MGVLKKNKIILIGVLVVFIEGGAARPAEQKTKVPLPSVEKEKVTVFEIGPGGVDIENWGETIDRLEVGAIRIEKAGHVVYVAYVRNASKLESTPEGRNLLKTLHGVGIFIIDADTKIFLHGRDYSYERSNIEAVFIISQTSGIFWFVNHDNHSIWAFDNKKNGFVDVTTYVKCDMFFGKGPKEDASAFTIDVDTFIGIMRGVGINVSDKMENEFNFLQKEFDVAISKNRLLGLLVNEFVQWCTIFNENSKGKLLVTTQKYNVAQILENRKLSFQNWYTNFFMVGEGTSLVDIQTLLTDSNYFAMTRDVLTIKGSASMAVIIIGTILKKDGLLGNTPSDILEALNFDLSRLPENGLSLDDLIPQESSK